MRDAHNLAKDLKTKYGIQHLLLEPPQVVHNTSDCVMEALANPDNQHHLYHLDFDRCGHHMWFCHFQI